MRPKARRKFKTSESFVQQSLRYLSALVKWPSYYLAQYLFLGIIPRFCMSVLGHSWEQAGKWFQLTGKLGLKIFGIDAQVYNPFGVDLDAGPYIIVSNHRSWFDQVAITAKMNKPFHILANEKYFKMPTLGFALRTWQGIPVRDNGLTVEDNVQALEYVQRRDNFLFFVEGTRGKGKRLLPFRYGAFKLAAKTKVPILPLYIFGAEDCLHKSNSLLSVQPGNIAITFGKPLMIEAENLDLQVAKFRDMYQGVHDKLYDLFYQEQAAREAAKAERVYENVYSNLGLGLPHTDA